MQDDDLDDQPTPPREHLVTDSDRRRHFEAYPPGTLVVAESGPAKPSSAFEISIDKRVGALEASRAFWRWIAGIGIPLLVTASFLLLGYSVDKISASSANVGATATKIEDLEKTIASDKAGLQRILDILEQDIRELRKHAGLDPKPITIVTTP